MKPIKMAMVLLGSLLAPEGANAQNPVTAPDDSWITVSGTVTSVSRNFFRLDYGPAELGIEMDSPGFSQNQHLIKEGWKVIVTGKIDDDLFEARTLEASSVYVEGLETYFTASAADEEQYIAIQSPIDPDNVVVQGRITALMEPDKFVLNSGSRRIVVGTRSMPYNPFDEPDPRTIQVGDRVRVSGKPLDDLMAGAELAAESVIKISRR